MEFISKKLKDVKDLTVKLFYWDDTALIGTPRAVACAARVIQDLSDSTGLHLRWKKCHLHCTPNMITECKTLTNPRILPSVKLYKTQNMEYLKAPIGADQYVKDWLSKKLVVLANVIM